MGEQTTRVASILKLIAHHAGSGIFANAGFDEFGVNEGAPASVDGDGPSRLAADLESMGPTYIKLGQLLSTRYDLLPTAYTDALARLQDGVEPFDTAEAREVIETELGVKVFNAFTEFADTPMASASLGQVYRAQTRSGRDVVVKVQRPGVREIVQGDMELLAKVADMVDTRTSAGQRIGSVELLAQFRRTIADELDYRKEAANLEQFAELVENEDLLLVPTPIRDYSTSRVLTMEYIQGKKVTDLAPIELLDVDGPALADALFRFTLGTLLKEGLLHADPHPGNLLITPDGRLALIDLGMIARIPRRVRAQLVKLLVSIGEGDGEETAAVLASMGTPLPDFDGPAFRAAVAHLVSGTVSLGADLQAGSVMVELARLSGAHGLRPPVEMSLVGKALLNLDQSVTHLDPTFEPAEAIRDNLTTVLTSSLGISGGGLLSGALEAKEFAEHLPRRANRIMDSLTNGELTLRIDAFNEDRVMATMQRLTNRLTMGVVLAAITIAAALMMRADAGPQFLGYPVVALIFFVLAAVGGFALVAWIVVTDRRAVRREKRADQLSSGDNLRM